MSFLFYIDVEQTKTVRGVNHFFGMFQHLKQAVSRRPEFLSISACIIQGVVVAVSPLTH